MIDFSILCFDLQKNIQGMILYNQRKIEKLVKKGNMCTFFHYKDWTKEFDMKRIKITFGETVH